MPDCNPGPLGTPASGIDALDIPDAETGITPRELAEMGWPMTGEPVADLSKPGPT